MTTTSSNKIPDAIRNQILARISTEPSDTKLAKEFGVHRKSIYRLRQGIEKEVPVVAKAPASKAPASKVVVSAHAAKTAPIAKTPVVPLSKNDVRSAVPASKPSVSVVPKGTVAIDSHLVENAPQGKTETNKTKAEAIMSTYFAVQAKYGESFKDVVRLVLQEADNKNLLFRKLEVLDVITVGRTQLFRFRSDLDKFDPLAKSFKDRACVYACTGSYLITLPDGRSGKVPVSLMCSTPRSGFGQTYVGTKIKRWEQQFSA